MRRGSFVAWVIVASCLGSGLVRAQAPAPAPPRGDELRAHLEALSKQRDDVTLDLGVRERIALEMATTLDRAAATATTANQRRALWSEAAELLDQFSEKNPAHPSERTFRVQASVYLWARARDRLRAAELDPTDQADRAAGVTDLKECLGRLKPIATVVFNGDDVLAQNVRFRLAQVLADRAEFDATEDAKTREGWNAEALAALERPVSEPSLQGFALALRAELLGRLKRYDEALATADRLATARPAPPESDRVEIRATILAGKRDFAAAFKTVDASSLAPAEKVLFRARLRLAEYRDTTAGPGREASETALYRELKALRSSGRPETTAALAEVAKIVREPTKDSEPVAWDLLADGAAAVGAFPRAGELERLAAARADALGRREEAASYRLRAGAFLFQAESFADADAVLTRLAEDPNAGPSRPRAALLRSLARGRALAKQAPGASPSTYASALKYQIDTFANDPTTSEARWLLGKLRLAESDRAGALAYWDAIAHGSPRWAESRAEIAAVRQRDLDLQRLNNDKVEVAKRLADARGFLARSIAQAKGDVESNDLLLSSARLELTPGIGNPDEARKICEQIERSVSRPDQRDAARRLRIVALAALNRWFDAERASRLESTQSDPVDLLPTVRLLDRWAAESDSDLRTRRVGLFLRILLTPAEDRPDAQPADKRAEFRLRFVRALLFSGDDAGARRALRGFAPTEMLADDLLRDLAETFVRLEAYDMAVKVQQLRGRNLTTGSLPWFEARYGLALAYYRSGRPKETLQLIEATTILHPDLGGGELRDKFVRLRQRINPAE
jgi:hypothetical protein